MLWADGDWAALAFATGRSLLQKRWLAGQDIIYMDTDAGRASLKAFLIDGKHKEEGGKGACPLSTCLIWATEFFRPHILARQGSGIYSTKHKPHPPILQYRVYLASCMASGLVTFQTSWSPTIKQLVRPPDHQQWSNLLITNNKATDDFSNLLITSNKAFGNFSDLLITSNEATDDFSNLLITSNKANGNFSDLLITSAETKLAIWVHSLARAIYTHRLWPYVWTFLCFKLQVLYIHCTYIVLTSHMHCIYIYMYGFGQAYRCTFNHI